MNINLDEATDQIEKEIADLEIKIGKVERSANEVYKKITDMGALIGEYESRYSSQMSTLLFGLKAQKGLSFPESTPLDKIFDAFLAKTTAPEAILEGTDLSKDEYEGLVVVDEVFQGDNAGTSKALPSVKLM